MVARRGQHNGRDAGGARDLTRLARFGQITPFPHPNTMGQQLNKIIKRKRRAAYRKRKKAAAKKK